MIPVTLTTARLLLDQPTLARVYDRVGFLPKA